jgi:hypothetical protein
MTITTRTARFGATALWSLITIGCEKGASQARDSSVDANRHASVEAAAPAQAAVADTSGPAGVIRRYYAAIDDRNYDAAYDLWGRSGAASGQTRSQFAAGFTRTAHATVTIVDSARVEGAAGSQYATVPVTVDAVLQSGERQHFAGSYTLRRVMVDGAPADARRWHIESAQLHQT